MSETAQHSLTITKQDGVIVMVSHGHEIVVSITEEAQIKFTHKLPNDNFPFLLASVDPKQLKHKYAELTRKGVHYPFPFIDPYEMPFEAFKKLVMDEFGERLELVRIKLEEIKKLIS